MINIQIIDDNECFKWSSVKHVNPTDVTQQELDKDFAKSLILKTKFTVKIRDKHKIEKKSSIGIGVLGHENEQKYPIYASKKRPYVLVKDFDTIMIMHYNI